MDAWQAGVPVAFSNIAPFVEQLDRFGVEAWVFDPHDPSDVADKIHSAVFDLGPLGAMAEALPERSSPSTPGTTVAQDTGRSSERPPTRTASRGPRWG